MNRLPYVLAIITMAFATSCRETSTGTPESSTAQFLPNVPETPRDLLISTLDELQMISDFTWGGRVPSHPTKLVLRKGSADTTFIYGQITPDGYGAVVSEKHSYPRGIPLITVRKTYGKDNNLIVSELMRYASLGDLLADQPEQSVTTELYGLSQDTIVTKVTRNGRIETYTFRLPVVTVSLKSQPELSRRVARYASGGEIVTETRDGNDQLLQLRRNTTLPDGSLIARTEYPDGSWRQTRTVGRADGTILRETATSE
jgi:hypothetical protein